MAYTVLARRYRSRDFDELVGQEAIARTLKNAIAADRVAHAYLFVGTRGVGKTSTARIFANAINNPDGDEQLAAAIFSGQDTDVIEIDAASNSKVDETRELIANSVYKPLRGRYKVYIIDEVHMLSTAAFNALLKTLEEPPDHVKFILCTTETHKVPATIQSRCQRFDFRNLSTAEIAKHLREVVDTEKIDAEDELLQAVARLGNGSMRDALSLLDRLIAAAEGGETLSMDLIERLMGLPDRQVISDAIGAIAAGDAAKLLSLCDSLLDRGIGMAEVLESLAGRCRDLLVLGLCGEESSLVDLSGEARREAVAQGATLDAPTLTHLIALCEAGHKAVGNSSAPRALFDAFLARMALSSEVADAAALLSGQAGSGARATRKKA